MPDFFNKYNTQLDPIDEEKFVDWAADNNKLNDVEDYDLRGFYKQQGQLDERGHAADQFKKPNHPTFSNESIYNGQDGYNGGVWSEVGDKTHFAPSETNLQMRSPEQLQGYFKQVEPDVALDMPARFQNLKQKLGR